MLEVAQLHFFPNVFEFNFLFDSMDIENSPLVNVCQKEVKDKFLF